MKGNEGKSVVADLQTYDSCVKKCLFCVLKILLINIIIHTITVLKFEPIDFKFNSYAEYNVDSNAKDLKFKIGDHVRIANYKNIFPKGYTTNWSEEVFVISKIKNTVPQTCYNGSKW